MFELFMFGTFWFWALAIVAYIVIAAFVESGSFKGATIGLLVTGALYQWFGHIHIFEWVKANPKTLLLYLFAYLLAGFLYSLYKWTSFVHQQVKHSYGDKVSEISIESYTDRIINWMAYWPFSFLWTLLNDPIRRFCEFIVLNTKELYQNIANGIINRANTKLASAKAAKK